MNKQDVYSICRKIAPLHNFDPILILAICEQESNYETHARRLEQGFYWKYTRNSPVFNDVDEVLLAASWGLMQMMGESLNAVNFFQDYPTVYDALFAYLDAPEKQIETGCRWLGKKRFAANGDIKTMLGLWNGDKTGAYAKQVLERYERLKKEL